MAKGDSKSAAPMEGGEVALNNDTPWPSVVDAKLRVLSIQRKLHQWSKTNSERRFDDLYNLVCDRALHCVVPGGGIAPDRSRWIACRQQFLLPVKVLSRLFRANYLRRAFDHAELSFHGQLQPLAQKQNFITWLNRIVQSEWVVYAKPPFGGSHQVLKYLARYTHRVAIANQRLVALQDGHVSFRWKDYTHADRPAVMTLQATEFIRRFLLHVLPRGFVKIRHFGFLANRGREDNLRLCRALLGPASSNIAGEPEVTQQPARAERCPLCREGCLQPVEILLPQVALRHRYRIALPMTAPQCNTS
jgi:hypothetical protein